MNCFSEGEEYETIEKKREQLLSLAEKRRSLSDKQTIIKRTSLTLRFSCPSYCLLLLLFSLPLKQFIAVWSRRDHMCNGVRLLPGLFSSHATTPLPLPSSLSRRIILTYVNVYYTR